MINNNIDNAIDLLQKIKEADIATIFFIKKDRSERIMKCTLNFNRIPKEKKPKDIKLENILKMIKLNILRVFDVEKQDWRSIPVDSARFIIVKGERFTIKLKGIKK